ncbi:MAG: DUF4160 domain-containing protein [Bacteroidetes bacterium]|jgi:hypothetical protein|nr:DUF4160 domain-containing protein [Bacteroidota bacterium]
MPKIFEYLNIAFFFYSNEHEPVHVHAAKGGKESVFEILISQSKIESIKIRKVRGKEHLDKIDLKNAGIFVEKYADEIVKKWIDFFVYKKEIKTEIISKRL